MMEETEQLTVDDETTLVAPRFDDEETIVARRVVPLGVAGGGALAAAPARTRKPRRPLVFALAFASALGGGVLGGVGLHLYQSRATPNPTRDAGTNPRADAPAEVTQPAQAAQPAQVSPQPAPTAEVADDSPAPAGQQHDAPAGGDESQPAPAAGESKAEDKAGANEASKSPAAGEREASGEAGRQGARKRGKKGAHDGESQLLGRREDSDGDPSRDDDDDASFGREARGGDATFARPRRASHHARHERRHPVDSIRGIFEGQPQ